MERGHQVGLMREVYSRADEVVVFLGTPSFHTDAALDLMARADFPTRFVDFDERIGVIELLEHPYWSRAWIIQEVARSQKASIVCGRKKIEWEKFLELFEHQEFRSLLRNDRPISTSPAQHIRTIDRYRCGDRPPLIQVLQETRQTVASDALDVIYSKLGLASDASELIPDPNYELQVEELFKIVAATHITANTSLDILSLSEDKGMSLPSWAPDWKSATGRRPIGALLRFDSAKGVSSHEDPRFSEDLNVMFATGVHLDTIGPLQQSDELYDETDSDSDVADSKLVCPQDAGTMLPAICRTVTAKRCFSDDGKAINAPSEFIRIFAIRAAALERTYSQDQPIEKSSAPSVDSGGMDFNSWYSANRNVAIGSRPLRSWVDSYVQLHLRRGEYFKHTDVEISNQLRHSMAAMT